MSMVSIPPINMGEEIVFHGPKIYEDIKAKYGQDIKNIPLGAIGLYTYCQKFRTGMQQLMAGSRNLAYNKQLATIMKEGGKIIACRFALSALYGFRETDLLPGVQAIHPLDVLDCLLEHQRAGALVIATWTV